MAQILKDEIRENIRTAALEEFYEQGYHRTAMRTIAKKAQIPTGLIYSYFKSKEALFDAVLSPVLYDWEQVLTAEDDSHISGKGVLSNTELKCLLNLFEHRKEFMILMDKSVGTKYAQEKERLAGLTEKHLNAHRSQNADPFLSHIAANNFVDGILQIMYHYKGKEWAEMILHKLARMYLLGIGE